MRLVYSKNSHKENSKISEFTCQILTVNEILTLRAQTVLPHSQRQNRKKETIEIWT